MDCNRYCLGGHGRLGFATALGAAVPALSGDFAKDIISFILIVGLTIVNIFGVNVSKFVNNLITILS